MKALTKKTEASQTGIAADSINDLWLIVNDLRNIPQSVNSGLGHLFEVISMILDDVDHQSVALSGHTKAVVKDDLVFCSKIFHQFDTTIPSEIQKLIHKL
jgi:hypothetical protein